MTSPRNSALLVALAAGLALFVSAISCQPRPADPLPDIIMVVVDTLRSDCLRCYGDTAASTPFMDSLAARGARFEHAYAPSSWTMPSVASIFTSRYPSQHGVNDLEVKLSEREITLAERLSRAGYRTAGFSANWRLTELNGFGQGFGTWKALFPNLKKDVKVRGDGVRAAVEAWLDAEPAAPDDAPAEPLFLYVQYLETHAPLQAPAALREILAPDVSDAEIARLNEKTVAFSKDASKDITRDEAADLAKLYRAEVAAVDREIEALFADLESRGLLKNAIVILTSDHGEEFLEHGAVGHGFNLFGETARVPLIIAAPPVAPAVVSEAFSLIALAPTLLDMAGIAPERHFEGESRASLLRSDWQSRLRRWFNGAEVPDILLQLLKNSGEKDLRVHQFGLVRGSEKLLVAPAGGAAVYELDKDPREMAPIREEARRAGLIDALKSRMDDLSKRQRWVKEKVVVDEATRERLRALGYQQ